MSKDLMLLFASIIPEAVILEKLQEATIAHKLAPSEETKGKLSMYCMLFCSKDLTEKNGLEKMMEESSRIQRIHERMKGGEQS